MDDVILMKAVPAERVPYLWLARGTIALVALGVCVLVGVAFRKSPLKHTTGENA